MPHSKIKLQWEEKNMIAALECMRNADKYIQEAAAEFNVPKSLLGDRIKGRVIHGKKNGPDTLLNNEDEEKLSAYLMDVNKKGYGKSKEIILFMATQMAIKRGKDGERGNTE